MTPPNVRVATDSRGAGTDADKCLSAIRRISAEIECIARGAYQQGWTRPIGKRNPQLSEVLQASEQLREMSAMLDRQLRGRVLEVDRRNLASLLSLAYDCVQDGRTGKQQFIDRISALLENR